MTTPAIHLFNYCKTLCIGLTVLLITAQAASAFVADHDYLHDREALDELQSSAFQYIWRDGHPDSGMAYEANFYWDITPVAVGGTGFGVAAIVTAVDRGWITREEAVKRLLKIVFFLRDKTNRKELHGAFPHWLNGSTGQPMSFDKRDQGADIVETSMLMQGLLIARAYFNGPGAEKILRDAITEIWEDVDWNWFTDNEESGMHWHWSPEHGYSGLKILGYNECLITYVLAASSPTHPISRQAYDYWTSGKGYQIKRVFGYDIEASLPGGGPLFLTHYSFIGLDPRRIADSYVPNGYFIRNVRHTLSNRGYCLQNAPAKNRYAEDFWGLTASHVKGGYAVSEPNRDVGVIAPTGAISSMPYTPHYSMLVLHKLRGELREKIWGPNGPYDAISLRDNWVSNRYMAIDQLPMVAMLENYRSGLLWDMFMSDKDVRAGLKKIGMSEPAFDTGFPEVQVTLKKKDKKKYIQDAYDIRRHPDTGLYNIPYWCSEKMLVSFSLTDQNKEEVYRQEIPSAKGRNTFSFAQFMPLDGEILTLTMRTPQGEEHLLPIRLH